MEIAKNILGKLLKGKVSATLYTNREERYEFIFKIFKNYLKKSILDVGCSEAFLKKHLAEDVKYIGVDIEGNPDFIIDLEKEKLSQFKNKSFYVVICTEVLEHLDNLHEVFDELTRVSEKYVIISLPNSWFFYKFSLLRGKTKGDLRFYGLPIEKPPDRHKWFFNYDEALEFVKKRAEINNFRLKTFFPHPIPYNSLRNSILDFVFKFYYKNRYGYNNIHYVNLWAVLERKEN